MNEHHEYNYGKREGTLISRDGWSLQLRAAGGATQTNATTDNPSRGIIAKGTRSGGDHLAVSKKARKQTSLGSNPDLKVTVIDRSDRDGKSCPANWLLLEEKAMRGMLKMMAASRSKVEVRFSSID